MNNQAITQNQITLSEMTIEKAIQLLKDGNDRFVNHQMFQRNFMEQVKATTKGQYPFAIVLSCIDSRVPTEILFDQGVGDIFNACIAGNVVNEDILGSMEYACKVARSKLILVLGHTSCGAVKGACDHVELGNLSGLLGKLTPALKAIKTDAGTDRSSKNLEFVNNVALKNVWLTIDEIKKKSPILNELYLNKEIAIVGAMYSVENGTVEFMD